MKNNKVYKIPQVGIYADSSAGTAYNELHSELQQFDSGSDACDYLNDEINKDLKGVHVVDIYDKFDKMEFMKNHSDHYKGDFITFKLF